MTKVRREELLAAYWNAQAQFGPFEFTADEFVASFEGGAVDAKEPYPDGTRVEKINSEPGNRPPRPPRAASPPASGVLVALFSAYAKLGSDDQHRAVGNFVPEDEVGKASCGERAHRSSYRLGTGAQVRHHPGARPVAVHVARAIADCMMYGLITGPEIDVARCDDILERGSARGVRPSRSASELAIELVQDINQEASP